MKKVTVQQIAQKFSDHSISSVRTHYQVLADAAMPGVRRAEQLVQYSWKKVPAKWQEALNRTATLAQLARAHYQQLSHYIIDHHKPKHVTVLSDIATLLIHATIVMTGHGAALLAPRGPLGETQNSKANSVIFVLAQLEEQHILATKAAKARATQFRITSTANYGLCLVI